MSKRNRWFANTIEMGEMAKSMPSEDVGAAIRATFKCLKDQKIPEGMSYNALLLLAKIFVDTVDKLWEELEDGDDEE